MLCDDSHKEEIERLKRIKKKIRDLKRLKKELDCD